MPDPKAPRGWDVAETSDPSNLPRVIYLPPAELVRLADARPLVPTVGPDGEEPDYFGIYNDARGGDE